MDGSLAQISSSLQAWTPPEDHEPEELRENPPVYSLFSKTFWESEGQGRERVHWCQSNMSKILPGLVKTRWTVRKEKLDVCDFSLSFMKITRVFQISHLREISIPELQNINSHGCDHV